ncbi:MAG: DegT/DnrJ/EryC1/StrS family aminotransferase [Deltaproteobacteria bacterium]|nr:DegT/DnrJ/EryC1/StrS family aminotransferase [Deltaproteobacteria bacterium]
MVSSVPFVDLKAQHHRTYNEIDDKLTDVIANTAFILGKYVEEFEGAFAAMQGAKHCIGLSSGTDALHIALLASGIGPGDGVILPVNTFIATAEAVSLCGATPVFVDCDEYYNVDVEKVRELMEGHPHFHPHPDLPRQGGGNIQIKAIIPVHLYGQPANMEAVGALADQYGLTIVEDCCQAHLARYQEKPVGNFGAFGAFSFFPGKNLGAYGEAGALITNDDGLYEKARMIRQHGEIQRYQHQVIGHNYRMEAFQGAVLSVKAKYLAEWTEKRRVNAALYREFLKDVEEVQVPTERENVYSVYHLFVIQAVRREALQKYLLEKGIATGLHYPTPLHLQLAYQHLGYKTGDFPIAEAGAKRILSLPMYPELDERQIRYVADQIKDFYAAAG